MQLFAHCRAVCHELFVSFKKLSAVRIHLFHGLIHSKPIAHNPNEFFWAIFMSLNIHASQIRAKLLMNSSA